MKRQPFKISVQKFTMDIRQLEGIMLHSRWLQPLLILHWGIKSGLCNFPENKFFCSFPLCWGEHTWTFLSNLSQWWVLSCIIIGGGRDGNCWSPVLLPFIFLLFWRLPVWIQKLIWKRPMEGVPSWWVLFELNYLGGLGKMQSLEKRIAQ